MPQAMIMPKKYFFDANGDPLAFGKVYTYQTQTTNNKESFTTEAGDVANTNPVILNGEGYAPIYLDGSYSIVVDDANDVNIWTADPVSSNIAEEWIGCEAPSYVSSTSFKITNNVTSLYEPGRRVRIDNNVPTLVYSTIKSSSFSAGETTIVVADGVVAAGIIGVCASIVGTSSIPKNLTLNYSTMAEAVADVENIIIGDVLILKERTSGNGGGAIWDAVDANTVIEDGYSIVSGDTSISFALRIDGSVNVRQFGATGDGVTDDTAAIQASLDATLNLLIPLGTYRALGTITFRANHSVRGDGIGLTILNYDSAVTLTDGFLQLDNTDNAYLSDLSVTHSSAAPSTSGIELNGASDNIIIERVSASGFITNFWLDGAEGAVAGTLTNCKLIHCIGHGSTNQYGFRVQNTKNLLLEECIAYSNTLDGFKLRASNDNLKIRGGVGYDNGTGGNNGNGIDFLSGGFETTVTDFECYGNDGAGIYIKTSIALQPTLGLVGNISLNNCVSHNNGTDGVQLTRDSGGALTDPLLPNVQINGGRYYENGSAGLIVSRCRNVNITGSHCYDNQTFGVAITQALDICLVNVDVTHNCLDGVTLYGVQISTSHRVSVIGGNIIGVDTANIYEEADYALLTATHSWSIAVNLADCSDIHIDKTVAMSYNLQPQCVYMTGTADAGASIVADQKGTSLPENVIYGGPGSSYLQSDTTNENELLWIKVENYDKTGWKVIKPVSFGIAAPVSGTWARGSIVYDSTPDASGFIGWVCVVAGTPGTWKTFGAISA